MNDEKTVPDTRVGAAYKNSLILAKMAEAGLRRQAELSRATGVRPTELGKLINKRRSPKNEDGEWVVSVLRIAEFFTCLPEELFSEPERHALDKDRIRAETHFEEMRAMLLEQQCAVLTDPVTLAETRELRTALEQAIGTLAPKAQQVLFSYFGLAGPELTLDQLATRFGVTRAHLKFVLARAISTLRRSPHSLRILEAAGIDIMSVLWR